jgi:hypothetical protein
MNVTAPHVNIPVYNDVTGNQTNIYGQPGAEYNYFHGVNLNILLSLGLGFGELFDRRVVSDAAYNRLGPRTRCLEGTRGNVIIHVEKWLDPVDQGGHRPICWFSGPAGCVQLSG